LVKGEGGAQVSEHVSAYMCNGNVLQIFFLARRRVEDDVVDGLDELQLDDAFDCENLKQSKVRVRS
jgi:hypothetical protein